MPQILFTWHGGETLMRPLAFYKRAMELQQKYAHGRTISNCIQTNGTLLTDEWCEFLKKNDWLVGVSIDGPQEFHDRYRRNKQGQPSFVKVMKGIHLLNKYGVDWNGCIMMSVSITYSYLTQLWRIGSVKIQAYAQWEKRAGMQG